MAGSKLPKGISLRADGRYMWRFQYGGVTYSGYCKNVTEAKKALRDKKYEVEHGISGKEQAIIMDAWFPEWLNTYKAADCKESTLNLYRNVYKRYIQPEFGKKQIRKLRGDMLQRFVNKAAGEYSKAVASTINFLLYDSLRQAARNGLIVKNPMENTTPPKFRKREKKGALTEEAQKAFLEEAQKSVYYPLYRLATLTGMRIGEVLGLQWSDVDFRKGEIHITHTMSYIPGRGQYLDEPKSAMSRRIIPMEKHSEAYKLLKDWRKQQGLQRLQAGQFWKPLEGMENLVFTTNHGTPHYDMNIRTDQRKIVARLKEQGVEIDTCTFHTLRHCFATRCIENGMDVKTLQMILGHSTFSMTVDLYVDVMEETKREEMKKVAAAL
ncbi:MAG: site-specific integrase [Clostridiales bacterium]|nr:site-specific integrase [Clostridiales bacterium]